MEVAADGSSITFTLRPGVKWHPVEPVNSRVMDIDDWKTSFERHLELSPHRKSIADFLDKVEYPDDRTMVWEDEHPLRADLRPHSLGQVRLSDTAEGVERQPGAR